MLEDFLIGSILFCIGCANVSISEGLVLKRNPENMKKEVVIAIVVGFIIGATAAIGILVTTNALQKPPNTNNKIAFLPSITPEITSPVITQGLEISSPASDAVTENKSLNLQGKTYPDATIIVDMENDTIAKEAEPDGSFDIPVILGFGGNRITVTSYPPTQPDNESRDSIEKTLTLFYFSQ